MPPLSDRPGFEALRDELSRAEALVSGDEIYEACRIVWDTRQELNRR